MGQCILINQRMEADISIHQIFYSRIDLDMRILKKYDGHRWQRWFTLPAKSNWNTHSQGAAQSELGRFVSSFVFLRGLRSHDVQ